MEKGWKYLDKAKEAGMGQILTKKHDGRREPTLSYKHEIVDAMNYYCQPAISKTNYDARVKNIHKPVPIMWKLYTTVRSARSMES